MMALRPFGSDDALFAAAHREWLIMQPADWKEAFARHPRIGDRDNLRARFPGTHQLSASEQAGLRSASDETLDALAAANSAYERRFGYIFIVCATGKSAAEMLDLLRERMRNEAEVEILAAMAEQARITELRLRRL
jgi:2-oxo-4-hydroxy-4-carboxy-5-ureidoimidazoline decarboxylase